MNQIRKGSLISYTAIFLNIAAGLIYTPWMIREIGADNYGLFALIGAFLSYFTIDFGLGSAIARFISKARAEGDENRVAELISTTTRIYLIIDLFIALALTISFLFLPTVFSTFSPVEMTKFKVIYCIAGLFSLLNFSFMPQNGILIAYEKFVVLKSCDMVQKLSVVIAMTTAILCGYGLYALVFINGLIALIVSIFKFIYINKETNIKVEIKTYNRDLARQLFNFSVWIFIITIAQRLLLNIAPTLLGMRSDIIQISIFSIGMTLETYTWTFAAALNGLFLSRVARISTKERGSRHEMNCLMVKVGRVQLMVIGFIICALIILGRRFINLWMGETFDDSYIVALCLITPGIIRLTQEIANSLLMIKNEVKYRAWLYISSSIVCVVIGYALAPSMGAIGVALGVFIALIICHVIGMNIVYFKVLRLDIIGFFKKVHLSMIIPMILSSLLSSFLIYLHPIDSWFAFIAQGIIFTVIYYVSMWILSFNEYEKSLFRSLLSSITSNIIK
ncbi:MAG: oligosaccharide flippase family protein [Rikenellaceae bacterium]